MPPSRGSEGGGPCRSALFLIQSRTPAHPPTQAGFHTRLGLTASFHSKGASGWRQTEKTVLTFLLTSGILYASCVLSVPFIRL